MSHTKEQVTGLLNAMLDEDQVTPHHASLLLGIAYPTMMRLVAAGHVRHVPKGGRKMITVEELKRFNKDGNYSPDSPGAMTEENTQEPPIEGLIRHTSEGLSLDLLSKEQLESLGSNPYKEKA